MSRPSHAAALPGDVLEFTAAALRSPVERGRLRIVACPAPVAPPEALLHAGLREPAVLWAPPGGAAWAGLGHALRIEGRGPERFEQLEAALTAARRSIDPCTHPAVAAFVPSFFGGLAFEPGAADTAPWSAFGDASLVLPRWTYRAGDGEAVLALAIGGESPGPAALLAELSQLLGLLANPPDPPAATGAPRRTIERPSAAAWGALVGAARAEIARGTFEKVVLARQTRVTGDDVHDPATVARRLAALHPDAYRFAFRRGDTTFLGASPEPLVIKRGRRLDAEALAGTASRSPDESREHSLALANALVRSAKDNDEHRPVVVAIREALAPFCSDITVGAAPEVRVLPHVLHLSTPIRGYLRHDTALTTLVRAVHPTPAMGGYPRDPALRFIAAHEPTPRGWYAGPVGRIGADGDGEFAVAIRCALLSGTLATIFAGAGIVAGSDPQAEFDETAAKERTILAALELD